MFNVDNIAADKGAFRAVVAARVAANVLPLPLPTLPLTSGFRRDGLMGSGTQEV